LTSWKRTRVLPCADTVTSASYNLVQILPELPIWPTCSKTLVHVFVTLDFVNAAEQVSVALRFKWGALSAQATAEAEIQSHRTWPDTSKS